LQIKGGHWSLRIGYRNVAQARDRPMPYALLPMTALPQTATTTARRVAGNPCTGS
jgi:hypothetical protein